MTGKQKIRRRWRDYQTASGNRPIRDFILDQTLSDRAEILAAMEEVRGLGLEAARHVRGDSYEVRAVGENRSFRILFAPEGHFGQVLLSLEAFVKKTQKTPEGAIELALERLRDWRQRGKPRTKKRL